MRCISPQMISKGLFVACARCNYCLQAHRGDWSFRIGQHLKVAKSASFLTFTYAEENLPINAESGMPELSKRDYQLMVKRLRKFQAAALAERSAAGKARPGDWPGLSYYSIGEYGDQFGRPHYHSLMFNMLPEARDSLPSIWKQGLVHVGKVEAASIHYVTGYVINRVGDWTGRSKPFALISKGIGKNYFKNEKWHKEGKRSYVLQSGTMHRLPRYFKDKIFNVHEKELLRVQAENQSVEDYWKEVQRLSLLHPDPERYMEERLVWNHEKIREDFIKGR